MMPDRVRYRKLPGHRRGFIRGFSVWIGPDHLLAVNSMRFREEYKRYYFRDIQAIVIAESRRFHISTRTALIGYLWLIAFVATFRLNYGPSVMGGFGIALVLAWIYISATCSCTCRIHTAVSQDRLPSIYRIWTSRKFLRAVEAEIAKVQGALARPLDVEGAAIGPQPSSETAALPKSPGLPAAEPLGTTLSFHLLLAGLFADAVWHWYTLQHAVRWGSAVSNSLGMLEIALSIFVLVQYRHKGLRPARQKFAIATLVGTGVIFYGTLVGVASFASFRQATSRQVLDTRPALHVAEEVNIGATLALGLMGLIILVRDKSGDHQPGSFVS
jgi:hypothetical protein